jgi:hypothetical protein
MAQRVRPVQRAQRVRRGRLVLKGQRALRVSPDLRAQLDPMARHFTHNYSPQAVTSPYQPVLMRYSWSVPAAVVVAVVEPPTRLTERQRVAVVVEPYIARLLSRSRHSQSFLLSLVLVVPGELVERSERTVLPELPAQTQRLVERSVCSVVLLEDWVEVILRPIQTMLRLVAHQANAAAAATQMSTLFRFQ